LFRCSQDYKTCFGYVRYIFWLHSAQGHIFIHLISVESILSSPSLVIFIKKIQKLSKLESQEQRCLFWLFSTNGRFRREKLQKASVLKILNGPANVFWCQIKAEMLVQTKWPMKKAPKMYFGRYEQMCSNLHKNQCYLREAISPQITRWSHLKFWSITLLREYFMAHIVNWKLKKTSVPL
jgi:hypothetical protein